MATNTITVVLVAVAAVLLLIGLGLLLAQKRTERRRAQAWLIRDIASDQPRELGRRRIALAETEADQHTRQAFDYRPVQALATQPPPATSRHDGPGLGQR
jgi:hypothetical protein